MAFAGLKKQINKANQVRNMRMVGLGTGVGDAGGCAEQLLNVSIYNQRISTNGTETTVH